MNVPCSKQRQESRRENAGLSRRRRQLRLFRYSCHGRHREREREICSHSVAAYTRRKTPGKKNTHIQTSKCVSVSVCLFPFLFFIFLPSLRHDTRQTHSVKGHGTYGALLLLLLLLLLFLLLPASNTPPAYTCLSASISRFSSHILHFISHTAHSLLMFLSLSLCL